MGSIARHELAAAVSEAGGLGTIAGVCVGTFLGAWIVELLVGKEMGHSVQIGVGAAKGRLLGTLAKTLVGVVMLTVAALEVAPLLSLTVYMKLSGPL